MQNAVIVQYLEGMGFHSPAGSYAAHMDAWLGWYRGYVGDFHDYAMRVGTARRTLTRYRLGMAKTVCEDFATLLLNERVRIKKKPLLLYQRSERFTISFAAPLRKR